MNDLETLLRAAELKMSLERKGDTTELDPSKIRDISGDVLDEHGRMRILPGNVLAVHDAAGAGVVR